MVHTRFSPAHDAIEVVFLDGPAFGGKEHFFDEQLHRKHGFQLICSECKDDGHIRGIKARLLEHLNARNSVAILDRRISHPPTRASLLSAIKKWNGGTDAIRISCATIEPKLGLLQCNWTWQWIQAKRELGVLKETVLMDCDYDTSVQWYDQKRADPELTAQEDEGFDVIFQIKYDFKGTLPHALLVPSLLLHWNSCFESSGGEFRLKKSLHESLSTWTKQHENGRVIILGLETSLAHSEEDTETTFGLESAKNAIAKLSKKLILDRPVYYTFINKQADSSIRDMHGIGLIAWLQAFHFLRLDRSICILDDFHRIGSQIRNLGIRTLNISQASKNPKQIVAISPFTGTDECLSLITSHNDVEIDPLWSKKLPLYTENRMFAKKTIFQGCLHGFYCHNVEKLEYHVNKFGKKLPPTTAPSDESSQVPDSVEQCSSSISFSLNDVTSAEIEKTHGEKSKEKTVNCADTNPWDLETLEIEDHCHESETNEATVGWIEKLNRDKVYEQILLDEIFDRGATIKLQDAIVTSKIRVAKLEDLRRTAFKDPADQELEKYACLIASVRGSKGELYDTHAVVDVDSGDFHSTGCSCPFYGHQCKHLVAMLLFYASHPGKFHGDIKFDKEKEDSPPPVGNLDSVQEPNPHGRNPGKARKLPSFSRETKADKKKRILDKGLDSKRGEDSENFSNDPKPKRRRLTAQKRQNEPPIKRITEAELVLVCKGILYDKGLHNKSPAARKTAPGKEKSGIKPKTQPVLDSGFAQLFDAVMDNKPIPSKKSPVKAKKENKALSNFEKMFDDIMDADL
eukprot:m.104241 g.104241  ORF g.104241 m.104241 type:complete len:799 (+) comp13839_c0_seq1:279-2675(+)